MAGYNNRSRYQYETSPRKLEPEYKPTKKQYPKKSTARKNDVQKKAKQQTKKNNNLKIVMCVGTIFVILFAVSYRNALIAQKYSEIKKLKSSLSEVEKENKQLEVNIESKTNLGAIEKKATEELGLKKLDDSQIVYVNIDKQDYVESSSEEVKMPKEENWFESLINKIKNIF